MKPHAGSSDIVAALLEDDLDPKEFAYDALPSALDDAWKEVERRTRERIHTAWYDGDNTSNYAHDVAVLVAGEVAAERGLDKNDHFMWKLISQAARFKL